MIAGVAYAPETLLTSHIVIGIGRARIRLRARKYTDGLAVTRSPNQVKILCLH